MYIDLSQQSYKISGLYNMNYENKKNNNSTYAVLGNERVGKKELRENKGKVSENERKREKKNKKRKQPRRISMTDICKPP